MHAERETAPETTVDVRRLPALTPYARAWELQKDLVRLRKNDEVPDTFILCEHPPVFTVGRAAKDAGNLGAGEEYLKALGAEVFWSDRGGDATFHGPGQIVGYPILRLKVRDTHAYLRGLEEVLVGLDHLPRLRPEREDRPLLVRPHHPLRHQRIRRHQPEPGAEP